MRYVALLSGGKDSCFNLLHCAQNGHELLAAASLGPGPGKEEIDSYLYQTVGQDAIQLVADALEVPLFRGVISGEAKQQGSEYGPRLAFEPQGVQGDETEDLLELLIEVKAKFPEVQGVSVGAILSNYQRVRVEHVCQRLSLTPMCYLWQRDQSELLTEMIGSGLEAILIKVAGIGLTTKHLGMTLLEMQPTLMTLNSMYGAHVCGEGGEYESLTLDSPLFKHRIVLEEVETVIHSDNDFATVAYLKVKRAHLEKKASFQSHIANIPFPSLLREEGQSIKQAILDATGDFHTFPQILVPEIYHYEKGITAFPCSKDYGRCIVISNIQSMTKTRAVEDEVRSCFKILQDYLAGYSLDLSHIANIILLISSMELFPLVNAVYASFFGSSPPSRACVAVDLPPRIHLRLECMAYRVSQPHERTPLHVQSLSYWAPANIGPYSQAVKVGERVFVSGQIGLVPSSNTIPSPRSLSLEVALSIQHLRSISDVVKDHSATDWDGFTQCLIFWLVHIDHLRPIQHGMMACETFCQGVVPTLFVTIKSLPKNALVETQILLHTGRKVIPPEDYGEPRKSNAKFSSGLQTAWEASYFHDIDAFLVVVACKNQDDEDVIADLLACIPELKNLWQNTVVVRLFHTPVSAPDLSRIFHLLGHKPPVMAIPSRAIATWARADWDYALCFIG